MSEIEATSDLPPLQYAVMELLAARYRLGETCWTVHSKVRSALENLEFRGLIRWKHGVVENSSLVWLTDKGKKISMSPGYQAPILIERADEVDERVRKSYGQGYSDGLETARADWP